MRHRHDSFKVDHYQTADGVDVIANWLDGLPDRRATARIAARILRLSLGLFGDCKPLRNGVWELRVDEGPGYRIYYARAGRAVILLLCAGSKRTQRADIERAIAHWNDWQERTPQ